MTGYLTQRGEPIGDRYNLVIPNREIRNIITNHILKMFKESIKEDGKTVGEFCDALLKQNPEKECENALQQITDIRYTESLEQEGIHKIIKYGIACYKKKCKVMMKIEE